MQGSTGAYGFRLLDFAGATPVAADGSVTASTLTPARATNIFSFTASAGEKIILDVRDYPSNASWRIFSSNGRQLFGPASFDYRELILPVSDTYYFVVEGRVWDNRASDDYAFILNRPADPAPVDLALNDIVEGTIAKTGDVQRYQFTVDTQKLVIFDSYSPSVYLEWALNGPKTSLGNRFYYSDSYEQQNRTPMLLEPGDYELVVRGSQQVETGGGTLGDYKFRLLDAAAGTMLAVDGSTTSGTLDPGRETDVYRFTATEGEKVFFDGIQGAGNGSLKILDAFGQIVYGPIDFRDAAITMPRTGTYTLLVEGRPWDNAATINYQFALSRIEADPAPIALNFGERTTATIAKPTQKQRYTFTLTAPKSFYFDSFTPDSEISWAISSAGLNLVGSNFYNSDSYENSGERIFTLPAGDYNLDVSANAGKTGSAEFRLIDTASATALTFGQPVRSDLTPLRETDLYSFEGTAGETIFYQNLQNQPNASLRIIDPDGLQFVGPTNMDNREIVLPKTGRYLILLEGRVWDASASQSYGFTLQKPTNPTQTIAIDGTTNGALTRPGKVGNALALSAHEQIQIVDPALDLRQDVTIEFWINPDRQADTWSPIVYKANEAGQRDYSVWFNSSGFIHFSTMRGTANDTLETANNSVPYGQWSHVAAVLERSTGTMKIYVNGVLAASRSVSTALSNGSPDTPLIISGTSEYNEAYRKFEGGLDEVRVWSGGRTEAQIVDNMNAGAPADSAGLVLRLGLDGVTANAVTNSVNGATIPVLRDLANVKGVVEGRLDTPGDKRTYTFTVAERTMMAFDSLHDNDQMVVSVTGPGGFSISRNLRNGDSYELGGSNPVFTVEPGTYTIVVDGTGAATGAFAFRLLNLSAAPLMPFDTAISQTASGSSESYAYRLDVNPGDNLLFDVQQLTNSSSRVSYRLIDPYGRQIFGPVDFSSRETGALAIGGVYTLIVEPRVWREWPVDFRFAAYKVAATPPIAITLDGPNPQAPQVQTGKSGNALTLRGVDYVEVPSSPAVSPSRNLTVEGWFKLDRFTNSWTSLVAKSTHGTSPYRIAVNANGSVWAAVRDASGVQSIQTGGGLIAAGEWAHIALVADRDGGAMKILVNGVEQASGTIRINNNADAGEPLLIGQYEEVETSYGQWEGAVDSFRIWDIARSEADVAAGMTNPPASGTSGLLYALDFENTALSDGALLRTTNANGVSGSIAQPGESDVYSFSLTAETLVMLDSLTNSADINWTLTGPQGEIVSARRLSDTDSADFTASPVLRLGAGDYTLKIDATGSVTGHYNFRLRDLSLGAPLTLGAPVSGTLTPTSETDIYRFAANAGEKFFFDGGTVHNDMRWRLIDPFGNEVFGPNSIGNIDGQELAISGVYSLLIEGRVYTATVADYQFGVYPITTQTAALTIGSRVDGAIGAVGESDAYSFTLSEATKLVFDALTTATIFNWTLRGPDGVEVDSRNVHDSDGFDFGGNPVLNLGAGSYTLTIDATAENTGDYSFRLLDLASAEELVPDGTFNRTIGQNGRETDMFRFTATPGMRFGFDVISNSSGNNSWRLIDPMGQVIFGPVGLNDTDLMTAAMAGTYTLLVEGRRSATTDGSYSFIYNQPTILPAGGQTSQDFDVAGLPYVLGNHRGAVAQILSDSGDNVIRLTDSLQVNSQNSIAFSATGSGRQDAVDIGFDFRLTRRAGQASDADGFGLLYLPVRQYGNGGPGLLVTPEANLAGALGIGFDTLSNGEVNANHISIHYNGVKLTDIADPGLTLASGDWARARILVERTDGGSLLTIELTPQGGATVAAVTDFFVPGMELEAGRLVLGASQGGATADQDFDNFAIAMTAAAQPMTPLALNDAVSGSIAVAGAVQRYEFTLTEETAVIFDALTNNSALRWQISGPTQTPAVRSFNSTDSAEFSGNPVMTLAPGTYSVAISATGTNTGSYSFRLASLADGTAINLNETQDLTLTPGNLTAIYRFDATAGQALFLDLISGSNDPFWRLIDPAGNLVFNTRRLGDLEEPVLPLDGTYTLLIEGRVGTSAPQTLSFRVVDMVDSTAPLTIGETINGTIAAPGAKARYSFSVSEPQYLIFDSLINTTQFGWTLAGPSGTILSRNFQNSDAHSSASPGVIFFEPGDYTVTVDANDDLTGDFAFRLLDTALASDLVLNAPTTGRLEPGNSSNLYKFTGAVGDEIFLDFIASAGSGQWRLFDPDGRVAMSANYRTDTGFITLEKSGIYTLAYEGQIGEGGPVDYQFQVDKVVHKSRTIDLGETISSTLDQPRQKEDLLFTLTEETLVYVDALAPLGDVSWRLTGPAGDFAALPFTQTDSYDRSNAQVVYRLPAGDHVLRIESNTTADRDYSIRLQKLADALPITPGVPVNGTLSPGSETDMYRFDGEAGDRFYFDRLSYAGVSTHWRLIAPNGRQLFAGDMNDVDTLVLPDSGTYTLLIEGYVQQAASVGTYSFNVIENTLIAPIRISSLEVRPSPDLIPIALAVSSSGTISSGSEITISWKTRNQGTLPTDGAWQDRVLLRNLDTNEIIGNILLDDSGTVISPEGERQRQTTLTLPTGNRGVGRIGVTVTNDVANTINEENILGTAETNNAATLEFTSQLAPFRDLVVSDVSADPAGGWNPGDTVTVNWTTTNAGNSATTADFSERLFVRNVMTGQQVQVATVAFTGALGADEAAQRSTQIIWPTGILGQGIFEISVVTDIFDQVAEANTAATGETNNSTAVTITSAPDLQIRNLAITNSAPASGDVITLTWDESNQGNVGTLAGFDNRLLVQNLTTGETLLNSTIVTTSALAAGESRARTASFTLPEGQRAVGDIRVTIIADSNANGQTSVREAAAGVAAEGNNSAQAAIAVTARQYADLRVSNVSAPANGLGGGNITVSWTVTNAGVAIADGVNWSDRVILSSDAVIGNADDVILGNIARTGGLAAGGSYNGSGTLALPNINSGDYRIYVVADAAQDIVEPDTRADNVGGPANVAITSRAPNLVAEAISGPTATVLGGDPFTVSWRVRNTGDAAAAGGHVDRLLLSADGVADAGDLLLAEVPREAGLAIGDSYTVSVQARVQDGRSGDYRLILVTDAGSTVFENGLEGDNAGVSTPVRFAVAPSGNLVVESVSAPAGARPGETVEVSYIVRNSGTVAASAPWTDRIYVDDDTTVSGATSLANIARTFDLAPGEAYEVHQTVTLPVNLADGSYSILVRADVGQQVFEGGIEADNDGASDALVLTHPDLVPLNVTLPGGVNPQSNSDIAVTWQVRNDGTGASIGGWTDSLWLSRDGTVGAGDIKLGEVVRGSSLGVGEVYDGALTVRLPIDASGDYRVIVQSDSAAAVPETSAGEANNSAFVALTVALAPYADLDVSNVTAPARTINDPARVSIGWTVTNIGTGLGTVDSWTDRVYVSRDDIFGDADDILLGELVHSGSVAVGESYDANLDLILPAGFYGRYTLFVRSDATDAVFENGEDANRTALAGFFDVSPIAWADLQIDSVVAPTVAQSGTSIDVTWQESNQGIGLTNTGEWFDSVYLERTDGSGRILLGSVNHLGFLGVGDSYERTANFTLPDGIAGEYRIVVIAPGSDNPNATPYEFAFTGNNSGTSAPISISLAPPPDLRVTAISAPTNGVEGGVVDISWTVKNEGLSAAEGSWVDRVYLRKAGDSGAGTLIGTYSYTGPLAAGTSYTRREEMRLPAKTSDRFEVIVVTDAADAVYEHTAETNNRSVDDESILVSVLPRPDLQISEIIAPDRVTAGATASVDFTVINQGLVEANGNWTDQVWLSLDDKISGDDILVSRLANPIALGSLESYESSSATFTVPLRFRGNVFVLVATDSGNAIDEWPNDTTASNVRAQQIYVEPVPFADLVVDNVVTNAQAFEGNSVPVRYTVTNRGAGTSNLGQWTEQVWLTKDKNRPHPGLGDILLTSLTYTGGPLEVGQGYDRELTVTLPASVVSGTYYIMPWVDPYATLLEDSLAINVNPDDPAEIQSSNYRARAIQIVGTPPVSSTRAIAVTDVTAPAEAKGGDDFTVSWTVRSTGDARATGWTDQVYLADAPLLENARNIFNLGSFDNLSPLDPGASYTNSATFKLNPAAAGLYVIVKSQLGGDPNTLDNAKFASTSVTNAPADLQVVSVVPAAPGVVAYSGERTSVTYTVENKGAPVWSGTQYWTDQVWVSKDPTFIENRATYVGSVTQANEGLGTGQSYTNTLEFDMPPGVDGEYYVYVFTNTPRRPVVPSDIVRSGDNDSLRDQAFRNFVFELPAGTVKQAQFPVVYREADLKVTELTLPDTLPAGGTVEISFRVENVGTRATREDSWVDRVYLSLDASLDEGDWLMSREASPGVIVRAENAHVGILNPGESYIAKVTVSLPFELEGEFNVIAAADSGLEQSGYAKSTLSPRLSGVRGQVNGKVKEYAGEGNNLTVQPVTLTPYTPPDLQVASLGVPLRATRGQPFRVEYSVTNAGGATPALQPQWDDLVYLSRDPFLDLTSDRFLGSIRHTGGLDAGGTYSVVKDFVVPGDLGTEAYYVFVVTDPARYDATGSLFEADERNNIRGSDVPMVIELPPPTDIQVTDIVAPDNKQAGDPVTISWTVTNKSTVTASGSWSDAVYLSRDATWDVGDKFLGRANFAGSLLADQSYTLSWIRRCPVRRRATIASSCGPTRATSCSRMWARRTISPPPPTPPASRSRR